MMIYHQSRPKHLPEKCDFCAPTKTFTLKQLLQYKEGVIVTVHQNEVRGHLPLIVTHTLYYYSICNEPIISYSWKVTEGVSPTKNLNNIEHDRPRYPTYQIGGTTQPCNPKEKYQPRRCRHIGRTVFQSHHS